MLLVVNDWYFLSIKEAYTTENGELIMSLAIVTLLAHIYDNDNEGKNVLVLIENVCA